MGGNSFKETEGNLNFETKQNTEAYQIRKRCKEGQQEY